MRNQRIARHVSVVAIGLTAFGAVLSSTAKADTSNTCVARDDVIEAHQYLRAASLDLRGNLPTSEEVEALDTASDPVEQVKTIAEGWLATDEFLERVVRHHRDLFWDNITNQSLVAVLNGISSTSVPLEDGTANKKAIWIRSSQMSFKYRKIVVGGVEPKLTAQIPCLTIPQADLNAMTDTAIKTKWGDSVTYSSRDGIRYIDLKNPLSTGTDVNVNTLWHREGYVDVHPYWAPDTTIQVCAFDAQTAELGNDGVTHCNDATVSSGNLACGCGVELRYCGTTATTKTLLTSFSTSLEKSIRDVVDGGTNYYDLFLSTKIYVNGPIAYLYRYQTGVLNRLDLAPMPLPANPDALADFTAVDTWQLVDAGDYASGVLTNPGYLLRFQTQRARANRFYDKFLCQPFQAPAQGLPSPDDPCSAEPDLQKRCGCDYCHVTLEPASAHWGRWTMNGSGYLNPTDYPKTRDDCLKCASGTITCSTLCSEQYHVKAVMNDDPYLGMLNAYEFIKDADQTNIEQGPQLLVKSSLTDGTLQECTVRSTFSWLVGRDADDDEDEKWIAELADAFRASNYDYLTLIRSIITNDNYRRVP